MRRCLALSTAVWMAAVLLAFPHPGQAATKWKVSYSRMYGRTHNAGSALAELFAIDQNGALTQAGMTNQYNAGFAIFGNTNPGSNLFTPGNARVLFDPGVDPYDFQVYESGVATENSGNFWWNQAPLPDTGFYSCEIHFTKVLDDSAVTFTPFNPVYHYDLVNGFNTSTTEAPGYNSDAYSLTNWTTYQAQTFVVPAGINRITAAKAFVTRGLGDPKFRIVATIRDGGPTGTQIGPAVTSREVNNGEFNNVLLTWGLNDVPVTPGGTYALRVEAQDGNGFNVYAANSNNYPSGNLYNGTTSLTGRDMVAVVIGAQVGASATATPTPAQSPTPTPTPGAGQNLLQNPSFELSSGTTHPSWINNTNFGTNGTFPNPPGGAWDGANFASFSYGGGASASHEIYQTVNVTPNQPCTLSVQYHMGGLHGSAQASLRWFNGTYTGNLTGTTLQSVTWTFGESEKGWATLSGQATPTTSQITLILRVDITGNGAGVNLDMASLVSNAPAATATPTPAATSTPTPPTGQNLLQNPSFELSSGTTHPSWTNNTNFGTNGTFPNPPGGAWDGVNFASYSYGGGASVSHEIYQTVTVTPNQPCTLSVQYHMGGLHGSAQASLRWFNGAYTGNLTGTTLQSVNWAFGEGEKGWAALSGQATPTTSQITLILRVDITGNGAGVNLDMASLVSNAPAATATPTPSSTATPAASATPTATAPPGATATPTPTTGPTSTPGPSGVEGWRTLR